MTEILNLDKLIANVIKIQVGKEKIDIPINDRNTKLLASYDLAIMGVVSSKDSDVNEWVTQISKDWQAAEDAGESYKPDITAVQRLTMETADEMKEVVFEYIDKLLGEGYAGKFYNHFGESTNALSTVMNAIKAEYEKETSSKQVEQEEYFLNREQRRKGKKKKGDKVAANESIKSMANMDVEKLATIVNQLAEKTTKE